jgi:hypothetical protein
MATDGTQYLIELAAKFSGGDAAVATVADLGDKMLAAGATAQSLDDAMKLASTSLDDAATAAAKASAEVAASEAKYKAAEMAADRAAKAVERIGAAAQAETGKLQAALDIGDTSAISRAEKRIWAFAVREQEATAAATQLTAALKGEATALDLIKDKATAATATHDNLKKGLVNIKGAAEKAAKLEAAAKGSGKVNEMAEAMGKLGGPAGVAGQKVLGVATGFSKLKGAMGTAGPYVAVAVAIVAIASAAMVATVAIAQWAVGLADVNRTQGLLAQGIDQSVEGGDRLNAKIGDLSKTVPQSRAELASMASDLAKTGLRGEALTDALEDAAVKAAKVKWGPDFARQMTSMDVQSRRFGENLNDVFGGLKIDGLLDAFAALVALFDSSSASGQAMKFLFESLFQPLIDTAVEVMPKIERMFLHAVIWALKAYIALKPFTDEIKMVGMLLLVGVGAIVGVLAVAFAVVAVAIVAVVAAFGALVVAFGAVLYGIYQLGVAIYEGFGPAVDWLKNLGSNMIQGLIDGITGGAAKVVKAMTDVVKGGVDAVANFLGIHSRSQVLFDIGGNTAEGFTGGVKGGAADAQGALEAMVAPPSAGGARAGGLGGGGISISIGAISVNGENAKAQALDFIDQLRSALESEGLTLGGGEVPA